MIWKERSQKPKNNQLCLVVNAKYGMEIMHAMYFLSDDVFRLLDANERRTIIIDCTHWLAIPPIPKIT